MDSVFAYVQTLDLFSVFWLLSSCGIACAHVMFNLKLNYSYKWLESAMHFAKPFYYFGKLKTLNNKNKLSKKSPGSSGTTASTFLSAIPKRCFSHFYLVGLLIQSQVIGAFLACQLWGLSYFSEAVQDLKDIIHWYHPIDKDQVKSAWPVFIVLVCEELHLVRRLYECCCVSSFSNGTISIVHYFYGVAFYTLFGLGVVVSHPPHKSSFEVSMETHEVIFIILGVLIFITASYFQHKVMKTFSDLRIKEKDMTASEHYIPRGHLFDWVSSPHYLCEIVLYMGLCTVVRWNSPYLVCATVFVLTNQVSAGLSVHGWYRKTFPNYPEGRRAILPYIL